MKIITVVRTRNEERNIDRFCKSYWWADQILVADGGSTDNTICIAQTYPNVQVRSFDIEVELENGIKRNPQAEHLNFLSDWAIEEDADWIVTDDCDCIPNHYLQDDGRNIIETSPKDFVFAIRIYLYGMDNKYFPKMSQPYEKDKWAAGLWAWNVWSGVKFHNTTSSFGYSPEPNKRQRVDLSPPYGLLHYSWTDEEVLKEKLEWYKKSGQHPNIQHPLTHAGKLEDVPDWVYK